MAASRLRVEGADNPLGIDLAQPRLSWELPTPSTQTAYRVLVATRAASLEDGGADLWDSGRIRSSEPSVTYDGAELTAGQRCLWQVEAWDAAGTSLGISRTAWWEMALFGPGAWTAAWISAPAALHGAPLLRREFLLDEDVASARVYVSGLGYHELTINGVRVGDQVLSPSFTNYAETVHYVCHDVTALLARQNVIAVSLGHGWFSFPVSSFFDWCGAPWHGDPRLLLQLAIEYTDGTKHTVVSDGTWRCAAGPTVIDSVFGEVYDARLEPKGWTRAGFDESGWSPARHASAPAGRLRAETQDPIKIVQTLEPVAVTEVGEGTVRYDFGLNVAGWAQIRASGAPGSTIRIRYCEKPENFETPWTLAEGARSLTSYTPSPDAEFQQDTFILSGDGIETWEPRFSYKGFRWADVTMDPDAVRLDDVRARVVHSPVTATGEFECANPLLAAIHQICRRAMLNNLHGLPTDTPIYEKAGWTGDAMMTVRSALDDLDAVRLYRKYCEDMLDAQKPNGEVPPFVPTAGWGYTGHPGGAPLNYDRGPTPDFDAAYMAIPWELYRHVGDERILRRHFKSMTRYLQFLAQYADGHIVRWGLGDWKKPGCMDEGGPGENAPPHAPNTSPALIATAWYFRMTEITGSVAGLLGQESQAATYRARSDEIANAFNDAFLDRARGIYRTRHGVEYSQTSNALPLALGLAPPSLQPQIVANLARDVEARDTHLDMGIQGTRVLLPVLSDNGYVDLAYRLASQTTFPSWGWWVSKGATTCWEGWHPNARSHGHHFFGSIVEWFYEYLIGISPAEPGFRVVRIRPHIPTALTSARGSIATVRGRVACEWNQAASGLVTARVTLPGNTTGVVELPGQPAAEVGPGTHVLTCKLAL